MCVCVVPTHVNDQSVEGVRAKGECSLCSIAHSSICSVILWLFLAVIQHKLFLANAIFTTCSSPVISLAHVEKKKFCKNTMQVELNCVRLP